MFKIVSAFIFALPLLAAATPLRRDDSTGSCSSGTITCCNQTYNATSYEAKIMIEEAGLENHPKAYYGHVGADCSTGIGVLDGSTCASNPICCESEGGSLISIGCVAIQL